MIADLPEPMSPTGCQIRGVKYMPLCIHDLRNSQFNRKANDSEYRAGMNLWLSAFEECPAGSLPNDDEELCFAAGLGKDMRKWLRVKTRALHGFVLCADGRLYHPKLCEMAISLWEERNKSKARQSRYRAVKSLENKENTTNVTRDKPELTREEAVMSHVSHKSKLSTIEDKEERKKDPPLPSVAPPRKPESKATYLPDDWEPGAKGRLFAEEHGVDFESTWKIFRAHWQQAGGQNARKRSWIKAWEVWVLREAKPRQPPPRNAAPQMLLPITGGARPPEISCDAPLDAWRPLAESTSVDSRTKIEHPVVAGIYLDLMAQELCNEAGIPWDRKMDWSPLIRWLKAGVRDEDIIKTVRWMAARTDSINSLRYFDNEVMKHARRHAVV